jgi:DNA-binding transcriptional regulator YiaG
MARRQNLVRLANVRAAALTGDARRLRLAAGLSLREVAREVGCGPSTVHRWETGQRRPHGRAALRYAELLDELQGAREGAPMA